MLGRIKARYGRPAVRRGLAAPVGLVATDVSLLGLDGGTLRGWFCRPDGGLDGGPDAPDGGPDSPGDGPDDGLDDGPDDGPDDAPDAPDDGPDGRPGAPGAVVLHGWGGAAADMAPVAQPLIEAGVHALLLDARCHGRSDDAEFTSMPSFAADLAAGVRWLREQPGIDPDRVLLVGHSVGAGACLLAAREDPRIAAVISLSSMADPREVMARLLTGGGVPRPLVPVSLRVVEHVIGARFADFAPLATVAALDVPVLLAHGVRDAVVPVADVHRLAAVARDATVLELPDAGHAEPVDTTVLADALRAFARRTVAGHPG
ncbi:Dipeptidyl aminopeptidases/acylaminoacyl-peptidases-like protein [Nocardioides sp. JS614]|nr:Dipeptidyl aminopeptidases/acylaminoacyl-peptidases-like protein [Nocardioides sp. JS614]